jgi:pimeloyl-ACP methyl ester carboxylesterase
MMEDVVELMNDLIKSRELEAGSRETKHAQSLPTSNFPLPTFSIIGHSMGAKVAMLLALHHTDKIEKIIAVDMAPRYYPPHHQYIFDAIYGLGDVAAYSSRKEVERKLLSSLTNESTRQFILKNLYWQKTEKGEVLAWRFNLPVIEKHIEDMSVTSDSSSRPFNKPTLFIKGEKSEYITANDEAEIKNLFPQAIIKTIAGAGHLVHADKPKEFFEMVMAFLK